jgi:hypothetical protein
MKRRTKAVLLIGGLAVTTVVATYAMLSVALARVVDPQGYCNTGFSRLSSCTLHWMSRTTHQSKPAFGASSDAAPSNEPDTPRLISSETTAWAVAQCPRNAIANRLLCAVPSAASVTEAASDDRVTGLPRPKPWLITTAKNSPFIEALHIETPLDLAATLGFYRAELLKRGWTETDGAVVEADRAVIAFTTSDGPAQLRLTRQDGRTVADVSRRKADTYNAGIVSMPGQARLMLGNATGEEAVMSINGRSVELAAGVGDDFRSVPETGNKSPAIPEMNLAPGRYNVTRKLASGASESRVFEVAANETWGLLAGADGIIPLRLY